MNLVKYQEERRQECSIISDGVYELTTEIAYCAWMAKPNNGA